MINQLLTVFSGTGDARGFNQWKEVNRSVKKGAKAIYILVPWYKTKEDEKGDEIPFLNGFMAKPVFRVEDTEGEELDYQKLELPELPLMDKAEEWGINVKAVGGSQKLFGYYLPDYKEICLATPEEKTFFHELSHVAHEKVLGVLMNGQHPTQEIVAELSAQVLCRIVGKTMDSQVGNSYRYIGIYAEQLKCSPYTACLKLLSDVEKVLDLILDKEAA